ncbi:MAG: ABC1 kinase family protein [Candidatus Promineifilaceae bacterium]|jgi:ubiquinone biosynthesis protein
MTVSENNSGYEVLVEHRSENIIRRYLQLIKHGTGLLLGGAYTYIQREKAIGKDWSFTLLFLKLLMLFSWPFVDRNLIRQPFALQFRKRLEMLGPTYIKLGQILSLREDILPKEVTDELQNLLDRLPALTFDRYVELLESTLMLPIDSFLLELDTVPLGSASLAQTHRAVLLTGEEVVLKMLKPNVRQMVKNDLRLMRLAGRVAQIFAGRFQPRRLISEFSRYTLLEVDLRNEANNAEIFAANFADEPNVHFPIIYRSYSNQDVLCMEFFRGHKPDARLFNYLTRRQVDRSIDLGIGATIEMIFRDGFFHADLHPGNLIVFDDASIGFIDLGMVGRFDSEIQRRMLYYLYFLVSGDAPNAARYLVSMTIAGPKSDPDGFRRAVEDLNRRWLRTPNFDEFSLGQLILESVTTAARYNIQYPGEIILMVKSMITLEGMGNVLSPGIDITDAAKGHVQRLLYHRVDIRQVLRDGLVVLPEVVDLLYRSPYVLNEVMRYAEQQMKSQRDNPVGILRGTIFGSFTLLSGAIVAAFGGPVWLWAPLILIGFTIAGFGFFARR